MAKTRRQEAAAAGVFRPATPDDTGDVVKLFAVAARVVCALPSGLEHATLALDEALAPLEPPESLTAKECMRLWQVFARTVKTLPDTRWDVAGKALLGDLEALGQRLDLMPLPAWERLPVAHDDPRARPPTADVVMGEGKTVEIVRKMARDISAANKDKPHKRAQQVIDMLMGLAVPARSQLITQMIDEDVLSKSEGIMLTRLLAKKQKITSEDEALIEVIDKAGAWLAGS